MPHFYKCVIRGLAGPQEVNTILYYGNLVPTNMPFDESDAAALGNAVASAYGVQILPLVSSLFTLSSTDVSMVDENGEVVSPYVVSIPSAGTGGDSGTTDTLAQCFIAKFNCTPVAEAPGHAVPRRSYVAPGPLTTAAIGSNGAYSSQAAAQTAATAAFTQGHTVGAGVLYPYRIGRTIGTNLAGVGRVQAVIVRPFTSFRRSRLYSPTGA